ncbi:hypothetical protein J3A78_006600 [Streptomyces sp. PvR006]|nr:hypothetical protein [Streptomyces sp. PvR006]
MEKSRPASSPAGGTGRWGSPPVVLGGFLLLLALVFTGSYALGSAVGPIGPAPDPQVTTDPPVTTGPPAATEHPHHGGHS